MSFIHGTTRVSYNAGISACGKGEQWQRALALLSEMWLVKLKPTVISPTERSAVCARRTPYPRN
eukprot:257144-Pyramimonas_sp.AAC.1